MNTGSFLKKHLQNIFNNLNYSNYNNMIIRFSFILMLCLCYHINSTAKNGDTYEVFIDLNKVKEDQLNVRIVTPEITMDQVEFHIPKIVPGTYSIYNFGRFTSGFTAKDQNGQLLKVDSISPNIRRINNAKTLSEISYWVEDTYDSDQGNFVFEPAGTNIDSGKNFILNTYGFIGYLKGYKEHAYSINITRPVNFFGATSLEVISRGDSIDVFNAPNYFDLADAPIMYNKPDTVAMEIGGANVLISVYSPNGVLTASFVAEQVEETLLAQKEYLGGTLPVDRYAFLIYLFSGRSGSGGMGALEHSYSSLYSLPEVNPIFLTQAIKDVAAHEFFHIVTPLNIHSEEIGNFDFIEPKMSKHLWLYDGVTEYAAGLAQVKYGKMSDERYLDVLLRKIASSERFQDDLPFTELSKKCLDEHKSQYSNVYQKGALIGMALDIQLLHLSDGKYGLQDLMTDLAKEFGKHKSFADDELFDKIEQLTYPEIKDFLITHVEGSTPLPYKTLFELVGVKYVPPSTKNEVSLGHMGFGVNDQTNRVIINSIDEINEFAKNLGYQIGDEIVKFDGIEIDIENFDEVFGSFKDNHQAGDKIRAVVLRKDDKGKTKKVKLQAKAIEVKVEINRSLEFIYNLNDNQKKLRKAWIGNS